MRINHNISALRANNQLGINNKGMDKSLERLSSGYRINKAADDAAGLAISEKMRTQIRGLEQASRNAADGISLIQTAEGALAEVESMLQRMRELSVQSANGTMTLDDRKHIQEEIDKLNEEIDRISSDTEFNTKKLLNGEVDRKTYSNNVKVKLISMTDSVETKNYEITGISEATKAVMTADPVTITAVSPIVTAAEEGSININGEEIKVKPGERWNDVITRIRDTCNTVNVQMSAVDGAGNPVSITAPGAKFVFTSQQYGQDQKIQFNCDTPALSAALGLNNVLGTANEAHGTDARVTVSVSAGFTTTTTVSAVGNVVTISDNNGFEMKLEIMQGAETTNGMIGGTPTPGAATITVLDAGPLNLQVGANEGQLIEVRIPEVSTRTLGTGNINMCTQDGSGEATTILDEAINQVSAVRAKLGAYQNRLDHTIANLDVSGENLTEALSRIADTDMAAEMATYTQLQVLGQASTSMLAQANERPQQVLSLLQG